MNELEKIKSGLSQFAAQYGPAAILPAEVTSVNNDDTVALLFSDGSTIDDARLKSVVRNGNKILFIPKIGSVVLVGRIENSDEFVVLAVEEITEQRVEIGSVKFTVTDQGFLLEKGAESLKKIFDDLFDAITQLTVNTNVGPSSVPINSLDFTQIKLRVDQLLQ